MTRTQSPITDEERAVHGAVGHRAARVRPGALGLLDGTDEWVEAEAGAYAVAEILYERGPFDPEPEAYWASLRDANPSVGVYVPLVQSTVWFFRDDVEALDPEPRPARRVVPVPVPYEEQVHPVVTLKRRCGSASCADHHDGGCGYYGAVEIALHDDRGGTFEHWTCPACGYDHDHSRWQYDR